MMSIRLFLIWIFQKKVEVIKQNEKSVKVVKMLIFSIL